LLSVHLGIEASVWLELKEDCHKIVDINRSILYKWRNEHPGKAKCRNRRQKITNKQKNKKQKQTKIKQNKAKQNKTKYKTQKKTTNK
jgi:hypothetical protein